MSDGEDRLPGRQHEREHVGTVVTARGGGPGRGRDGVAGQPVELRRILDDDGGVVRLGEQPGAELRGQRRELGVELPQPLLVVGVEPGARPHGVAVPPFEQPQRLGVEAQLVRGVSNRVSSRANSAGSRVIASACAASCGAISASISRMPGVLADPTSVKNTADTRRSVAPERSSATTVSSKLGGSGRPR